MKDCCRPEEREGDCRREKVARCQPRDPDVTASVPYNNALTNTMCSKRRWVRGRTGLDRIHAKDGDGD